jgi:hypothetical protein
MIKDAPDAKLIDGTTPVRIQLKVVWLEKEYSKGSLVVIIFSQSFYFILK